MPPPPQPVPSPPQKPALTNQNAYIVAWFLCLVFYWLQYSTRSAPSVMVGELVSAFGLTTVGLGSLLGLYYYTYSLCSIVSGAAVDRWGAKYTITFGALVLATGTCLFGWGNEWLAGLGRLMQGAGSAFAFVGAVYLAARGFSRQHLATAVGVTQCAGMMGGAMGQSTVAWLIHGVLNWHFFWIDTGGLIALVGVFIFFLTPGEHKNATAAHRPVGSMFAPYRSVLSNPQSYLCGLCSGLLFLPTTVGSMTWGITFLTQSWHIGYHEAVMRAAMVPVGWMVGCPALGYLTDRIGRRKPVLLGGIVVMALTVAAIIYLPGNTFPPYILAFVLGVSSGAAMIPYSIIKEVNADEVKGSATGAINFLVFVMSAIASPLFAAFLQHLGHGQALTGVQFSQAFSFGLAGIVLAGVLTLFLHETGPDARSGS
ncbi:MULTISPECIES: MFS transporter [Acetobacter]|uniref:MFS transporter n=1 Tax=Acetobacter TaxID=434 RepID=UPI00376F961E